jgi:LPXTG-site transpeptidase (sortase) family protein
VKDLSGMDTATSPELRAPRPRRRGLKALEWALILAGAACLVYVAAVRLTGYFGAEHELARFRAKRESAPAAPAAPLPPLPVIAAPAPAVPAAEAPPPVAAAPPRALAFPETLDFRLWSPERIKEYRASIAQSDAGPLALLRIRNLDIEAAVLPDSSDWALNRGLGWIEGTARPDENGNVGIAGHRDGFFRGLKDVAGGDTIELELPSAFERYRVSSITIVKPDDVSVLDPTPDKTLTLVTCYPFYFIGSAPERFIVRATRVSTAR